MGRIDDKEELKYVHFTHEHPLELINCRQASRIACSGCNRAIAAGKDFYTCKVCSYSLHRACYNMTRLYQHPAEPGHDLNLLLLPSFDCKACGLQGSGFCYNCRLCTYNYHSLCLRMPLTESCAFHQHWLKLEFFPPYDDCKGFRCDVCGNPGFNHWLYRCNDCEFDVHLNCVYAVPSLQFQDPISPNIISSISTSPAVHVNGNCVVQTTENSINQPHNLSVSFTRALVTPENNSNAVIDRASLSGKNTSYTNPSPSAPPANLSYSAGCYISHPGTFTQPGIINQSLTGQSGAQGILQAGTVGLLGTAVLTGIGEGIGQEIVQGLFNQSS